MGKYRGTVWDWPVIPLVAGVLLVGNWVAYRNGVVGLVGAALVLVGAAWLIRRRAASPNRR
jgi:membrane-bound ClpP family serine protease